MYRPGVWKVVCQVCEKELYSDECKFRWDGLIVCPADWEPRHPLDYMRPPKVKEDGVPFTSPEQEGIDGSPSYITIYVDDGYIEPSSGFRTYYVEEL